MFGEHFYVMPVNDRWDVRAPNKLDVHAYATEAEAVESALQGARATQRATGVATVVRVRNVTGSWRQLDTEGRATPITSL